MSAQWDGVPLNPETRGWHWLGFKGQHEASREPWAWLWSDEDGAPGEFQWMTDDDGDPNRMARHYTYLGPCITPADLAAAVQAERERVRGIVMDEISHNIDDDGEFARLDEIVQALDLGPTDALAARITEARREGMEAAAVIAEQREDDGETNWAAWPDGHDIAVAIRAAMKEQGE